MLTKLKRVLEAQPLLERLAAGRILASLAWFYCSLARACLQLGRCDEARRFGDRALEFCSSQPGFEAHLRHLLGDVAAHPDQFDPERGETHYRQALALAERLGTNPLAAHRHHGLGNLYQRTGAREHAQEHAVTATTMYGEMGMTYWLEQVEALRRRLRP